MKFLYVRENDRAMYTIQCLKWHSCKHLKSDVISECPLYNRHFLSAFQNINSSIFKKEFKLIESYDLDGHVILINYLPNSHLNWVIVLRAVRDVYRVETTSSSSISSSSVWTDKMLLSSHLKMFGAVTPPANNRCDYQDSLSFLASSGCFPH